ncbi:MAG: sodium:solute symporter family protein [Clostridia bacterium]|nr:sodium:solute symporter family protein [Clostridia bacterium]
MLEILVLLIYLAAMFAIGFYFKGKIQNTEDYYLSSRSLPLPVVTLTFAASFIGAALTMGQAGLAYNEGLMAVTLNITAILALFIFSFLSPRIREVGAKYNVSSIPDLFYKRFGKTTSLVAAVLVLWTLVAVVGSQMVASSTILELICKPWGVSYEVAVFISVIIVVVYTMMSGLYGVAYTDVVQGLLLILFIGIMLPILCLNSAGGLGNLRATLPANYFSFKPNMMIIGFMFVDLLYFLSAPPYWQRALAAKSSGIAKKGITRAAVIILFYALMVSLIGMSAAVIFPNIPAGYSSEEALIPLMVRATFHPLVSALVISAIMAVLMSTIDSYLINAAQTVITDIYAVVKKDVTDEEQLRMAKWVVVILGFGAAIFALYFRQILTAIYFAFTFFSSALSIPTLATLLWRKATKAGVLSGIFTGFVSSIVWSNVLGNPFDLHQAIPAGILCGIVTVGVSLYTYNPETAAPYFEVDLRNSGEHAS